MGRKRGKVKAEAETCPKCGGFMLDRCSMYEMRTDGVPVSRYVCRQCARAWAQAGRVRRAEAA